MLDKIIAKWRAWNFERIKKKCERDDELKLKVMLNKHKIDQEYTIPDKTNDAWDFDTYYNGNLFLEDKAQPLRLNKDNNRLKLMSSDRYRSYMNNKLVDDIVSASEEGTDMIMLISLVMNVVSFVLIAYLIMMNMGIIQF
jgi:hypothetical protein